MGVFGFKKGEGGYVNYVGLIAGTKDAFLVIAIMSLLVNVVLALILGFKSNIHPAIVRVNNISGETEVVQYTPYQPTIKQVDLVVYMLCEMLWSYNYENFEVKLDKIKPYLDDALFSINFNKRVNRKSTMQSEKLNVFYEPKLFNYLMANNKTLNKNEDFDKETGVTTLILDVYGELTTIKTSYDENNKKIIGFRLYFNIIEPSHENPYGIKLMKQDVLDIDNIKNNKINNQVTN